MININTHSARFKSCPHFRTQHSINFIYITIFEIVSSYYKNKIDQKPGWDWEILLWCLKEAKNNNLKEQDFWGGLILDEMKIQVTLTMTTNPRTIYVT